MVNGKPYMAYIRILWAMTFSYFLKRSGQWRFTGRSLTRRGRIILVALRAIDYDDGREDAQEMSLGVDRMLLFGTNKIHAAVRNR